MPFQLNAKNLSLTYPQCTATISETILFLRERIPNAVYVAVSQETHLDGGLHLHCGVCCTKPYRTKNARSLDYLEFHPNLQATRNVAEWINYLKKDGVWEEWGTLPTIKPSRDKAEGVTEEELIAAAQSMTEGEYLAFCSINKLLYAKQIWDHYHTDTIMTLTDDTRFEGTIDPRFQNLIDSSELKTDLALLIVGTAGIGKTTWAKQTIPKPCLFVTHIDDLRKFKVGYHVSILFDDVSVTHTPATAQIHLVDYENPRSVHVRYGVARIPAGVRKIFTCNSLPVDISHPAIQRRTQVLFCHADDLGRIH